VLELCEQRGITLMAYSPLGGTRRHGGLARNELLARVAADNAVTPAEAALAWLLELSPNVVAIPGARRPEAARSAVGAATLRLPPGDREALATAFGRQAGMRAHLSPGDGEGDVVIVMGIPGAGKSHLAASYVARGYARLNRDELGGTLPSVAALLDQELASGKRHFVLDNTYLSRAARSHVVEAATRNHIAARCVWLDTPLAAAQVNVVERMVARIGALPSPDEIRKLARTQPGMIMPTSQMRALRELEAPGMDEGFVAVERVDFKRAPDPGRTGTGVFVAMTALATPGWEGVILGVDKSAPHLLFDWDPGGVDEALSAATARLREVVSGPVEYAVCHHPAGPPSCWCRPPLPGLAVAFAHAHRISLERATVVGTSTAHRTMATALGSRFTPVNAVANGLT
jgi:predicted kinase